MRPPHTSEIQRLEQIIKAFDYSLDPIYQSVVAQYICVRLSGVLESAVRAAVSGAAAGAHPRAARYIGKSISGFQNPRTGKVLDLLDQFDSAWKIRLEQMISDEERDAVNSVVANRHLIAHGETSTVSLHQVKNWMIGVKKFCGTIEACCSH